MAILFSSPLDTVELSHRYVLHDMVNSAMAKIDHFGKSLGLFLDPLRSKGAFCGESVLSRCDHSKPGLSIPSVAIRLLLS